MRVFVSGATGFIGRALIPRLQREGHAVVAWARSEASARSLLGAEVEQYEKVNDVMDVWAAAAERRRALENLRPRDEQPGALRRAARPGGARGGQHAREVGQRLGGGGLSEVDARIDRLAGRGGA